MQMTMDQAMRPGLALAFALGRRGGYVMRSEKRPGYGGQSGGGRNGDKKPRRRRASVPYVLLTLLVSILLWPVGMVMLWRRKVRMQAGTKLLLSLLTLCLSIFLIVFALTVPVNNDKITGFQDKANDWLDKAAAKVAVVGDAACRKGVETWGVMTGFAEKVYRPAILSSADCLDKGVEYAGIARDKVLGLFSGSKDAQGGEVPADADAGLPAGGDALNVDIPADSPSPDGATPLEAGVLSANGDFRPGATPEPTAAPEPEAAANAVEPTAPAGDEAAPEVSAAPDEGEAEAEAGATPDEGEAEAEAGAAPAEDEAKAAPEGDKKDESEGAEASAPKEGESEPEANAAADAAIGEAEAVPTPLPDMSVRVMPAGEAPVYYKNTGKLYHMASACGNMTDAQRYTLNEAIAAGKRRCETCGSPDPSVANVTYVAWVDAGNAFHTSVNCESFEGQWRLTTLNGAIAEGDTPCPACEADLYALHYGTAGTLKSGGSAAQAADAAQETPAAEAEANATGEAEATPAPGPSIIRPAVALKSAGEATVYHSSNGKFYHSVQICKGMSGSSPYKLSDIKGSYRRCATCDAPDESLIGKPCLWMDENKLCHTYDACEAFKGSFKLILRDDALAQGLEGCTVCGANEYLIPNTVLADEE